ncbi:PLP-dependent aminotransferase family protein [Pokkaliibacter sp. CJK22405]|uniref:aminotransferase-like domain-containing protein n=1 Tax=Pokkaliibacter sp. CJK22405 TaxID=3384615 RepID=UPI003984DE99
MLYQQIAEQLGQQIRQGVLTTGQRVPSIRRLHKEWGVSQSTAMMALSLLEAQGLIEARPKSGFYVRYESQSAARITTISAPVEVTRHALISRVLHQSREPDVMHLGAAVPEAGFLPVDILRRVTHRCLRENPELMTAYAFAPGSLVLRQMLALKLSQQGIKLEASELSLTQGCQEALSLALQSVVNPGDLVAIESPAYHGLLQLLEALGLKALEIPCDLASGMNPEALAEALRQWPIKALVVSPNFSNPTGSLMPEPAKQQLLSVTQDYDLPVIEDDTYAELTHGRRVPVPLKAWDTSGRVLYCSAVSKTFAPGFRVGWIAAGRYHQQVQQLLTVTTMASHALSQQVVATFMQGLEYQRHIQRVRRRYRQQLADLCQCLQSQGLAHWRYVMPQGGFLLWLALGEGVDALQLHEWLLDRGVSIMPGSLFSTSEQYRHCIRISTAVEAPDWPRLVAWLRTFEESQTG